jgi:hypothetical protein
VVNDFLIARNKCGSGQPPEPHCFVDVLLAISLRDCSEAPFETAFARTLVSRRAFESQIDGPEPAFDDSQ